MRKSKKGVLLTPKETAQMLTLEIQTLALWRMHNKGPNFYKLGRAVRYKKEDVEAYLESCLNDMGVENKETKQEDERLDWILSDFFISQGSGASTMVWDVRDYKLTDLQKDDKGRFILIDQSGDKWRLVNDSRKLRKLLDM